MGDLTREERLQIMLTRAELEALDNWRFSRHMPSRASAVRELLRRGLIAEGFALADSSLKSRDFSVTSRSRTKAAGPVPATPKSNGGASEAP